MSRWKFVLSRDRCDFQLQRRLLCEAPNRKLYQFLKSLLKIKKELAYGSFPTLHEVAIRLPQVFMCDFYEFFTKHILRNVDSLSHHPLI